MIEVKNLYKSFAEKGILSDISFSLPQGQAAAIVGKSGAGKSVLLKCLIGLLKPDEGTIYVDNKLINSMNFRQLQNIRSSIGMVLQFGALFDSLNVGENISLALRKLTKLSDDEIQERVINSLESVDMANTEALMPEELSGGMKKRVGIARAIGIRPTYLFYDEPTTGLDVTLKMKVVDFFRKRAKSMIFISHDLNMVRMVSDRINIMYNGEIIENCDAKMLNKGENQHPFTEKLAEVFFSDYKDYISTELPVQDTLSVYHGCVYALQGCPYVEQICYKITPPAIDVTSKKIITDETTDRHWIKCWKFLK